MDSLDINQTDDKTAIYVQSSNNTVFSGLNVASVGKYGIETKDTDKNISISNTIIDANRSAIMFNDAITDGFTLSDSNISSKSENGIYAKDDMNGSDTIKSVTLNDVNITADYRGIRFYGDVNNGVDINNTSIDSQDNGINFKKSIKGGFTIKNSTIVSHNEVGIHAYSDVDSKFTIQNIIVNAGDRGLEFENKVKNGIDIERSSFTSSGRGIDFSSTVNGGVNIKEIDVNSTGGIGIYFYDDVNTSYDFNITDVYITSYDEGLLFKENEMAPVITDSNISSSNSHGIYTENDNDTVFTLKNSCVETTADGNYSFWVHNNSKKAQVSGNCFYATKVTKLGATKETDNNVTENYWDGNSGDYDHNNIDDTDTLSSCNIDCSQDGNNHKKYQFDAWDTFRDINDRNISTKIAAKDFNLTIAALKSDSSNYQEFNGTVCSRIIKEGESNVTDWFKNLFSDKNTSDQTDEEKQRLKLFGSKMRIRAVRMFKVIVTTMRQTPQITLPFVQTSLISQQFQLLFMQERILILAL